MKTLESHQAEYIKLLEKELSDLYPLARVHGWKPKPFRVQLGKDLRIKIEEAKTEKQ